MQTIAPDIIEALRRIDSPTIANAIEHFALRDPTEGYASMELRCFFPELPPVVGYAVTCTADSTTPDRGRFSADEAIDKAVRDAPKPSVVVIKDVGPERQRSCHAGDVAASIFRRLGAVALITDGGVRDLAGIRQRTPGFQVFAAGAVVAHGTTRFIEVGTTVSLCGMTIRPGDLLHGDANGLVNIPLSIAAELPAQAEQVWQHEREIVEYIQSADFTLEGMYEKFGLW